MPLRGPRHSILTHDKSRIGATDRVLKVIHRSRLNIYELGTMQQFLSITLSILLHAISISLMTKPLQAQV